MSDEVALRPVYEDDLARLEDLTGPGSGVRDGRTILMSSSQLEEGHRMSDEQGGEVSGTASGPDGDVLRQELARNVVEPAGLPPGYQLEGPAEPGGDADIPGVLGGPGVTIISEDEDEPDNRWSEHPR